LVEGELPKIPIVSQHGSYEVFVRADVYSYVCFPWSNYHYVFVVWTSRCCSCCLYLEWI